MSLLDKAKTLLKGNRDKAESAIDKAGDLIDDKTHGKYASQVDKAQEKAKDLLGTGEEKAEEKAEETEDEKGGEKAE